MSIRPPQGIIRATAPSTIGYTIRNRSLPIDTLDPAHHEQRALAGLTGRAAQAIKGVCLAAAVVAAAPVAAAGLPVAETRIETIDNEQVLDAVIEAVHRSTVSAQLSARVIELPFDVDDFVEQGEVIVRFRDTEQKARLEQARANLEESRAALAQARSQFERFRSLREKQLVSQSQMDQARADYRSAVAREEAAQAALAEAQEMMDHTVVQAPYSGIVVERHVEIGETASPGQPLMTGLSLEHLRAVVEVPQQHIGALRTHRQARVILPDGGSLGAAALRIFPYASEQTHTFRVRVSLPEGRYGVYPGMLVKVAFVSGRHEQLLIPAEAVVRRSEVTAAYVQHAGGGLEFRQIRVGTPRPDGSVPVLAGLEPGETIVTDPVAAAVAVKEAEDSSE